MTSLQENGVYRIYVENTSGARKLVYTAMAGLAGPGGSPDGAIGNTPEKWQFAPATTVVGGSGYKLVFTVESAAADTLDASDATWVIPVNVNGNQSNVGNSAGAGGLGNDSFVVDLALADIALIAGRETVGAIYRAKEGTSFSFGGGKIFYTYEDDTA